MEIKRATSILSDVNYDKPINVSITSEDVKRLNRQDYDALEKMSKEELIRFIMGDDRYFNRF